MDVAISTYKILSKVRSFARVAILCGISGANFAHAATIDTNPYWLGSDTGGWYGSGQSITVDGTESYLRDLTFYFSPDSNGRTFDFYIRDQINGGNILFQAAPVISTGANTIQIGAFFTPGSMIFAQFDYRGFGVPSAGGQSTHYIYTGGVDAYSGGYGTWGAVGSQVSISGADLRFIANFSSGPTPQVPLPGTLGLLGIGLAGLTLARRAKVA